MKYNRGLLFMLILSLCFNVFFVAFAMAGAAALAHPQAAIHKQFQKLIGQLPEQYKKGAQDQLDTFYQKCDPSIADAIHERKVFLDILLADHVDTDKALAEAQKIRELTAKIQEGIQTALITALKDIPREEKMNIIAHNRLLKAMLKADAAPPSSATSAPPTP